MRFQPRRNPETYLTLLLCLLTLLVGGWALWPALFPGVQAPTTSRTPLPAGAPARAPAAPEYPATRSVQPLISGRVNLNTATPEQIEALPGVGPALSARIRAGRPYRSLADLDAVRGIGPAALKRLTPLVSF